MGAAVLSLPDGFEASRLPDIANASPGG